MVDIQHLIYDDPDNVGPIPLVTPGREANFTWLSSRFKHYVAGRYYFPQFFIGTGSAGAVSASDRIAVGCGVWMLSMLLLPVAALLLPGRPAAERAGLRFSTEQDPTP